MRRVSRGPLGVRTGESFKMTTEEQFEEHIISQLEIIDGILSKSEVDVADRPFTAADIFVRECVLSVNGNPPDHYAVAPWFKHIIIPIRKWYETKYGAAATLSKEKKAGGVVMFNGAFYELSIPLRVIVPKGETRDFIFPKEVLPFEKESDFVKHPPHLVQDSSEEKAFQQDVRSVVNLTRSVSNNLVTCEFKHELCRELSAGIETHIHKAVDDMLSGENARYLNAFWEFQLALEKATKVLIVQSNAPNIETHDLMVLWKKLEELKPSLIPEESIAKFPRPKEVIAYRYGNGPNVRKADVHKSYIEALSLLDVLTREFDRRISFQNTVFVLGKLPWQE